METERSGTTDQASGRLRILVTGGCGFIGSNLVRMLVLEKGCEVINLDKLTYAGNLASLSDLAKHPNYHFERSDLAVSHSGGQDGLQSGIDNQESPKSLTGIFDHYQPDAVMHLAAESHVDRAIDGPGEFIQTNIVGTYNLLQATLDYWRRLSGRGDASALSKASGGQCPVSDDGSENQSAVITRRPSKETFRFLHVSTDEVYGSLAFDAPGFSESTPYDPHSPYSASKAASDHLARAWGDTYGLPVLVTNCSNNYGPYQFPEKLIPVVILKCLRGEPIPVYGRGENVRDWLYVEDHCEALYAVLTRGRIGETYNIGSNNEQKNIDVVNMICGLMDDARSQVNGVERNTPLPISRFSLSSPALHESLITFVQDRPGHDLRYAIDASKIRAELGWRPTEDFQSGFRKTVKWYLENRGWWEAILNAEYKFRRMGQGRRD